MPSDAIPQYFHDIFVSYSSIDRNWVEQFVKDLEQEVSARTGRRVPIWWDRQNIGPGDDWNEKMLQDARKSRVFVPVVSPSWLNSNPCQRELQAFQETAQPESLLPAIHLPIDPQAEPPAITKATQVRFHEEEHGVAHPITGEQRIKELARLAEAIKKRLPVASLLAPPTAVIEERVAFTRERIAPQILEKCGWMRILNMSQRIDASDIYTEVNIFEGVRAKQLRSIQDIQALPKEADFQPGHAPKRIPAKQALEKHPRLLILGAPGAGKTTFLRRLAVESIRGQYRPDLVPAYLEFRALAGKSILAALRELWETDPWPILNAGRALLLLDGLDELPAVHFEAIRQELDRLLTRDTRSPVIVTCRIAAREYVSERFDEIEIAEFTQEQIEHLARHWFPVRGYPKKVEPFLKNIKDNPGVLALATSPLLLTMICLYFEEHQDLNVSRAELYGKGLDTILERWDATREIKREDSPYGRLSTTARQSLYSTIALGHFEKDEVVFPAPDVKGFFSEPVENGAILQVMEAQHGLLIQRAQGIYAFSHLTFQEYLVAKHFVEDSDPERWDRLLPHLPDPRWREVFLLVTSMVSADYLVKRMQAWLNDLVSKQPAIQELLRWVRRKEQAASASGRPSAIRAAYFKMGEFASFDRALAFVLDRALARTLAFVLDRDLDRTLAFVLDRALALDRDLALDLDLARALALALALDRAHALALALAHDLALDRALDLARQLGLPEAFLGELETLKDRAKPGKVDVAWIEELKHAMIQYRDLGHNFRLDQRDWELLEQYDDGHLVLIECLKSERVSPATRAAIEDSLFLPADS